MAKEIRQILKQKELEVIRDLTSRKGKTNRTLIVKDKRQDKFFFKIVEYPDRSDAQTIKNEILFYTKIVPRLGISLCIPRVFFSSLSDPAYYIAELIQGEKLGEPYKLKLKSLSVDSFKPIVDFILKLQQLSVALLKKEIPEFIFKKGDANFNTYKKRLITRKKDFKILLGCKVVGKMEKLLNKREDFLQSSPEVFSNQDLNASNIILTRENNLKIIDSDTLRVIANPASVFTFLYSAFWPNPSLQQDFLRLVQKKAEKIYKGFAEYFRLDFIFFRGSGILYRYYKDNPPDSLVKDLKSAIEGKGIWRQ